MGPPNKAKKLTSSPGAGGGALTVAVTLAAGVKLTAAVALGAGVALVAGVTLIEANPK